MVKSKETKPFTLIKKYEDKFGSNAFKFDGKYLLCSHTFSSGNQNHLFSDDSYINGWGEVSIDAFETDEEYREIYKVAKNPSNRIYIVKEIVLSFFSVDDEEFLFDTTLSEFKHQNDYDDLDKDIQKIEKAKNGDTVIVDFEHIVKVKK